jgi:opacity protein-like surface antigen
MKINKSNTKIILYIGLLLGFTISNTFAKESYITTSAAMIGMSMDYKEYSTSGVLLDSEESTYSELTGTEMSLGYVYNKDMSGYSHIKLNLLLLSGETKYIGSYLNSGDPYGSVVSSTQNSIIDTDVSIKHTNISRNNFEFSYGVGLGYREWERALSASQIEVYKWYYITPIVGVSVRVTDKVKVGANIEYQHGFDTVMTSSNPKLDFTLGGANIWEFSVPISYNYNKNIYLFFEAIFSKQTIIESNVNSGYYEPDSTAYNNYLKFGAAFKF